MFLPLVNKSLRESKQTKQNQFLIKAMLMETNVEHHKENGSLVKVNALQGRFYFAPLPQSITGVDIAKISSRIFLTVWSAPNMQSFFVLTLFLSVASCLPANTKLEEIQHQLLNPEENAVLDQEAEAPITKDVFPDRQGFITGHRIPLELFPKDTIQRLKPVSCNSWFCTPLFSFCVRIHR